MKRTNLILVCVLAAATAAGQSPDIIRNTKAKLDGVRNNATNASNQALGITGAGAASTANDAAKPKAATTKPTAAATKPSAAATKPSAAAIKPNATPAVPKPAHSPSAVVAKTSAAPVQKPAASKTATAATPEKASPMAVKAAPPAKSGASKAAQPVGDGASADEPSNQAGKPESKWPMTGKRDPFVSPVVYQSGKSNCTTGKKCLEIGAINLRGVVRSENGFIAVVTNSLNKAYFLRENDPVFDGYVVKITGDSIVFQETLQDRLGKAFTREVVKKITTPSV